MGLLAGLAASPHCLGMCGAFTLHLSRPASPRGPVARHLLYLAGKAITYAFLGTLAGFAGHALARGGAFSAAQNALSYLAGGLLIVLGLMLLGLLPGRLLTSRGPAGASWLTPIYRHFLAAPGTGAAFLLGALTGFLPCPITFALLAAAAATHAPLFGLALFAGLGVGTSPALLGLGFSGSLLAARWRAAGLRAAGAVLLLLGAITALRPAHVLCRVLPVLDSLFPKGLW